MTFIKGLAVSAMLVLLGTASSQACARFEIINRFTWLSNSCSRTIVVTWYDQGGCNTGCSEQLPPGSRKIVAGITGRYRTLGIP
jgi:hypothetical protein